MAEEVVTEVVGAEEVVTEVAEMKEEHVVACDIRENVSRKSSAASQVS